MLWRVYCYDDLLFTDDDVLIYRYQDLYPRKSKICLDCIDLDVNVPVYKYIYLNIYTHTYIYTLSNRRNVYLSGPLRNFMVQEVIGREVTEGVFTTEREK